MQKQPKLDSTIGVFGGVSILTGIMVASGIFFVGSYVLEATRFSLPLALLAWLLGGLLTLSYGLMYAELGTKFPRSGGYYVYLKEAYGRPVAFASGFFNFVLASSGSIAVLALAFSEVLFNIVATASGGDILLSSGAQWIIAAGMIIALTVLNLKGVRLNTRILKILFVIKAIPITIIILLGIFQGEQSFDWSLNLDGVNLLGLFSGVAFAVIFTFWAYEGWTNLNSVAEEMKNPQRDLPRALALTILGVTALYVLYQFSVFRILSVGELEAIIGSGFVFIGIPATMTLLNTLGQYIVMTTIALGIFGALNASILTFPRVYYAMSQEEAALKTLGRVDEKSQTPFAAILVSSVMALVLLLFRISDLIALVAFGGLVFNSLVFVALFLFRRKNPTPNEGYSVPGYPYVPALTIGITLILLVVIFFQNPTSSLIGSAVIIVSYPLYLVLNKHLKA